jgi:hypothetical protein
VFRFIVNEKSATADRELTEVSGNESFGGSCDDVLSDEIADALCGVCTGFDGSADASDITSNDGRYETAADLNTFDNLHVGSLCHCIGCFNECNQTLCFD